MFASTHPFVRAFARLLTVLSMAVLVPVFGASARAEAPAPQGVVNINTASAEELMLLPRVGEGKAKRIVETRAKAPFKTVNDLARVKGIGLKTLRLLKPYIRIDGPTTLTSEVRPDDAEGAAGAPMAAPTPAAKAAPKAATGGTGPK